MYSILIKRDLRRAIRWEQIEKILGKIPPEGQVATRLVTSKDIDQAIEAATDGEIKSQEELKEKVARETQQALQEIKERGIDNYMNDLAEAFSKGIVRPCEVCSHELYARRGRQV